MNAGHNDHPPENEYTGKITARIRLAFFLTVLPMFLIAGATYLPLKENTLENSDRQMVLISSSGRDKLNAFLSTSSRFFQEWVQGDIFRLATEFDAWDDLKYQMAYIQKTHTEFPAMLMVDKNGRIIQESRTLDNGTQADSLIGGALSYFSRIKSCDNGLALVVPGDKDIRSKDGSPFLIFVHQTVDALGETNGYFLGFLDLSTLTRICHEVLKELEFSSLPGSKVFVLDKSSEKVVCWAANNVQEDEFNPLVPARTLFSDAKEGTITVFQTRDGNRHYNHLPLNFISDLDQSRKIPVSFCLAISVDEREIMAKVHRTLMLTMGIAGLGLVFALLLSSLTSKMLTRPINRLVRVLQQYTNGDDSVRATIDSRDEIAYLAKEFNSLLEKIKTSSVTLRESESRFRTIFEKLQKAIGSKNYGFRFSREKQGSDDLVDSLNSMLETLEKADIRNREEDWIKTGLTRLSEQISGNYQLNELCEKAVTFIARYIGALTGTVFIRRQEDNDGGDFYELAASFAYPLQENVSCVFRQGEGLPGQVVMGKKTLHLTRIPSEYLRINSSLGSGTPSDVLIIPLVYEDEVLGVMELAACFPLEEKHLNLAEQAQTLIAVAVYSAIVNDRFKRLSQELLYRQEELEKENQALKEQNLMRQAE